MLQAEKIDFQDKDYQQHLVKQGVVGVAIAAIVLVSFLLFFLISVCMLCFKEGRGCCQNPRPEMTLRQRLPCRTLLVFGALFGMVGAAIIISGGSSWKATLYSFIDGMLAQVRPPPPLL